ncbi:MAG: MFS transporter [Pseudobdellovibrio sp.]
MVDTKLESKKVLNPTVIKLGLVSFFADLSSEMLYPITPIFLTTVLGASMTSVGLIEGLAESVASLMKTFSGTLSDRISKRKPFIVFGYLLSAVAKPLTGIASSWTHVLFIRSLDRTGKGLRGAPRDALLIESVSLKTRGAALGWHRAMDTLGATIGPLLTLLYLNYVDSNMRNLFYLAVIPGLISVGFTLFVKEQIKPQQAQSKKHTVSLKWKELPKDFKKLVIFWSVFCLTNSSDVFILLQAKQHGVSSTLIILMYCFYNLTYALTSPSLGKLSDRFPRKYVLLFGLTTFAATYLGFSVASSAWHFWFLFGIYGLYMAATDGVSKALAVDLIEVKSSNLKASALGVLGTMTGISTVIASTVCGSIWDHFGSHWSFIYGATGALVATFLIAFKIEHT